MTDTLLPTQTIASPKEIFICPEESHFYSYCLEHLVLNHCLASDQVVEFGCGDGSPVIHSLLRVPFRGVIHGYDLNRTACQTAQTRIHQYELQAYYRIYPRSFFEVHHPVGGYLIANPPYIPAPDDQILLPLLHGGEDGATISNRLLTLGYDRVLLMLSSYSNPIATIETAIAQGYCIADFMVTPLKFGYYSSEPKVKAHLGQLKRQGKAFYSENIYSLAGVLFKKHQDCVVDLSAELLQMLTAL